MNIYIHSVERFLPSRDVTREGKEARHRYTIGRGGGRSNQVSVADVLVLVLTSEFAPKKLGSDIYSQTAIKEDIRSSQVKNHGKKKRKEKKRND